MPRRKTTLGVGPFGRPVPVERHAWEVLQRVLARGLPLTEDAIFLSMYNVLSRNGSTILQQVRRSSNLGGYRYFSFSPDIDLLEVRPNGLVVGYELKGERRKGRYTESPPFYEGVDQALAYLVNPLTSHASNDFTGSIFDHAYIVHPEGSDIEKLKDLLEGCTPLGLVVVSRSGTKEVVQPKPNPYLNGDLKAYFLKHLSAFKAYKSYKVNPIQ